MGGLHIAIRQCACRLLADHRSDPGGSLLSHKYASTSLTPVSDLQKKKKKKKGKKNKRLSLMQIAEEGA
jgi:hypothetical protein